MCIRGRNAIGPEDEETNALAKVCSIVVECTMVIDEKFASKIMRERESFNFSVVIKRRF